MSEEKTVHNEEAFKKQLEEQTLKKQVQEEMIKQAEEAMIKQAEEALKKQLEEALKKQLEEVNISIVSKRENASRPSRRRRRATMPMNIF